MKKNNNKQKNPGWNFALILVSLQHFKPRNRFLLFLLSSSIACISISVHLSFFLAFVSLENLNKLSISVGCLLFHHRSVSVLPFMPSVVGYLRLVGSPISFSPDFISAKHLISTQNILM